MSVKQFLLLVIVFGIFVLFLSCEEPINYVLSENSDYKYVIEGSFTTLFKKHKVEISLSDNFLNKGPKKMVQNAIVYINSENETIYLQEEEPGIYYTPFMRAIKNKSYELNVLINGLHIKGKDTVRELLPVDSIFIIKGKEFSYTEQKYIEGFFVFLNMQEKQGKGDCYLFELLINNKLYNDSLKESVFYNDEFIDGNYLKNIKLFFIKNDDLPDTSIITVRVNLISHKYYNYLNELLMETYWRGSPWDGPSANAKSNFGNKALGFFYTADTREYHLKLLKNIE